LGTPGHVIGAHRIGVLVEKLLDVCLEGEIGGGEIDIHGTLGLSSDGSSLSEVQNKVLE
jgi:basic membrane lipoprotein Med (substrate-binding protein (PBP1-ABC) superfamily)